MEEEKELWGRKFKVVSNGLDEAEVYSFVDDLTTQYADQAKKLDHLDSIVRRLAQQQSQLVETLSGTQGDISLPLMSQPDAYADDPVQAESLATRGNDHAQSCHDDRLANVDFLTNFAEKTIVEAAKQARIISNEIEEDARAKANAIIARAREEARSEANRIIADDQTKAGANDQQPGRADATSDSGGAPQSERVSRSEEMAAEMVTHATREAERHAHAIREQALNQARDALAQAARQLRDSAELVKRESDALLEDNTTQADPGHQDLVSRIHDHLVSLQQALETSAQQTSADDGEQEEAPQPPESADDQEQAPQLPESADDQETVSSEKKSPSKKRDSGKKDLFDGTVELAIPPPVGLDRMLQLHKHLKQTPNIDVLNLGGSVDKGITIRVVLDTPTDLLKVIGEYPEIEQVLEERAEGDTPVPSRQGQEDTPPRRIIVSTRS